ncbi:MAG: endonuclease domain-containing protein [Alphaproteobacteria bacterium]|nr:endonuclease domain-containing protein [Alphaproteobacteria bacterium]
MNRNFILGKAKELRKNLTDAEKILWQKVRNRGLGYKFVRQYVFDDKYILDFYCAERKLVIELDGGQHNENIKDKERNEYLKSRGCKILRFWNNDFVNNIEGCLAVIIECLRK